MRHEHDQTLPRPREQDTIRVQERFRSMAGIGPRADSPLYVSKRSIAANLSVGEDTRGVSIAKSSPEASLCLNLPAKILYNSSIRLDGLGLWPVRVSAI